MGVAWLKNAKRLEPFSRHRSVTFSAIHHPVLTFMRLSARSPGPPASFKPEGCQYENLTRWDGTLSCMVRSQYRRLLVYCKIMVTGQCDSGVETLLQRMVQSSSPPRRSKRKGMHEWSQVFGKFQSTSSSTRTHPASPRSLAPGVWPKANFDNNFLV